MGDIEEAPLDELFEQAEDALHPQSMNASASGWMAITEIFARLDVWPDDWDEMDDDVQRDIIHETDEARAFVTLQRLADERGIDVDYGLGVEVDG